MPQETWRLAWSPSVTKSVSAEADPDQLLVDRALAGDEAAFNALFTRHHEYVYNIVFGIVGREDEASDVLQEVFLLVYRKLKTFRRGSRFGTWLYRIAVNRAVDRARTLSRRRWLPFLEAAQDIEDPRMGPEEAAAKQSDADRVQRVLTMIPPNHRDVLVLKYYQEMSIDEMATVLGCSEDAAKVRLHRARLQFKEKYLAAYGETDAPA